MRYLNHYPTLLAVAIIALSGTLLSDTITTEALPISSNTLQAFQQYEPALEERGINDPIVPQPSQNPPHSKSSNPEPITTANPQPTQTQHSDPPTSKAPAPPPTSTSHPPSPAPVQPQPQPKQPSPNPSSQPSTHTNKPSGTTGATPSTGTSVSSINSGLSPSPSSGSTSDDGSSVPTGVSEKVWIGIGTVCGLLVFAFGGVAFCRQQRKKNLAKELLQQTAQFNHNNPYAKLSEPMAAAKESLPMTPTKPIGTFNVVATYTPALADEIEIGLGDAVTILQEYDDGWCLGVNNSRNGIKGVFPRHCLEGYKSISQHGNGGDELGYYPPNSGFKAMASKRMSSIPAGGWNNAPGGYNDYTNYPPNPVPPYNDQGYHNGGVRY
ncbi:hypothetical protein BGZ46_007081 [Entomortierella lignicola]|nr:hypothetical protein BGZ46_007081 [Entomortierella lignicola]